MEEKQQQFEWAEAQKIAISTDLVAAAKKQLQFLETVDRNRHLHEGPLLHRAIFRYKKCWLPLLAKHADSKFPECRLVVPLDCEWIWHCHRLNPVRYMSDCKELFGRVLDANGVVSSVQGASKKQTEAIWKNMYPDESYELDICDHLVNAAENKLETALLSTNYDLVSAVKRQTPFYYQVSRSFMKDDRFLEGAVERYKGFLHMIRRNMERKSKRFCVPTYDIDLIWHAHQLQPVSYCKDVVAILGKVLEHNDTDSDRTKGEKLDVGFLGTTKQWEETFGTRYWRAGAMYRGTVPATALPNTETKNTIQIQSPKNPKIMLVEVLMEIVGIRNLPASHKGNLLVSVSKNQPDMLFTTKRGLSICSEAGEKQVASFPCEPNGELLLELISYSPSYLKLRASSPHVIGTTSISLLELQKSVSKLPVEQWLELGPSTGIEGEKPIGLCIAVSITPPSPAPYDLHMIPMNQYAGGGACVDFCGLTKSIDFCGLTKSGGGNCVDFCALAQGGMCSGGCGGSGCGGGGCGGGCRGTSCGGSKCHGSCGGR